VKTAQVMTEVGRRVTELRRARGWSQEQFAERLRVDARTLQRIEAGQHITFAMLVQLAETLRVSIADLFEAPKSRAPRRPGHPSSPSTYAVLGEPPRKPYVGRRKKRQPR
jgi:transcriptional regulator with XRE-family HTH domain